MDNYNLIKTIGTGSFARVQLAQNITTKEYVAVKIIRKTRAFDLCQQVHTIWEYQILSSLKHPFIVEINDMYQDKDKIYFIMEYVIGGELFCLMKKAGKFKEIHTAFYTAQMILALQYLHKNNIIYRALVPENILIDTNGYIKLTDFGFSKKLILPSNLLYGYLRKYYVKHYKKKHNKKLKINSKIIDCIRNFSQINETYTLCGTPEYVSPEILLNLGYGFECDWWSLGIIIYELLTTFTPFSSNNNNEIHTNADIYGNIINENYKMKPPFPNTYFSENCKNLLQNLLIINPQKRLGSNNDAIDIMTHPFYNGINWVKLLKKKMKKVPWIPIIKNKCDTIYFEEYDNEEIDIENEKINTKTDIFKINNVFNEIYFDNSLFDEECKLVNFMMKQTNIITFNKNGLLNLKQFMKLLNVLKINNVYDNNVLERIFYFIQKNEDIPFIKRKQISYISYSNLIGCDYGQLISIISKNKKDNFYVLLSKLVLDQLQWVHNKILDGITKY
eukprot:382077_1